MKRKVKLSRLNPGLLTCTPIQKERIQKPYEKPSQTSTELIEGFYSIRDGMPQSNPWQSFQESLTYPEEIWDGFGDLMGTFCISLVVKVYDDLLGFCQLTSSDTGRHGDSELLLVLKKPLLKYLNAQNGLTQLFGSTEDDFKPIY